MLSICEVFRTAAQGSSHIKQYTTLLDRDIEAGDLTLLASSLTNLKDEVDELYRLAMTALEVDNG